jgi:hypothetical protein
MSLVDREAVWLLSRPTARNQTDPKRPSSEPASSGQPATAIARRPRGSVKAPSQESAAPPSGGASEKSKNRQSNLVSAA